MGRPAEKVQRLMSTSIRNKKAGFTLIELTVVIFIVALFSALFAPNVAAFLKGDEYRTFRAETKSAFGFARESAIQAKAPHRVRIQESSRTIEVIRQGTDGQDQTVRTVDMAQQVTVSKVTLNGQDSNTETWEVTFYPDGSATKAGLELSTDGQLFAVQVNEVTGRSTFIDGELPEDTESRWEAGEREQRGGG